MSEFKRRIVLIKDARHGGSTIVDETGVKGMAEYGYAPASQPLDIELLPLSQEEFTKSAIAILDAKIEQVRAKAHQTITEIEEHRQKLLALTYQHSAELDESSDAVTGAGDQ